MRLAYSSSCGLLSLVLSFCPWTVFAEESNELSVPTWRVQARAFGSESGQSLGVYHRLGDNWDWGVEVGTDFSDSESDEDQLDTFQDGTSAQGSFDRESESLFIDVDFDLRHWGKLRDKLSWFWGPRVGGGYDRFEETFQRFNLDGEVRQSVNQFDTNAYFVNAGFIVGADLELLKNLSTTFALLPVSFEYRWSDRDASGFDLLDGALLERSESDEDINFFQVDTQLFPTIYLALTID